MSKGKNITIAVLVLALVLVSGFFLMEKYNSDRINIDSMEEETTNTDLEESTTVEIEEQTDLPTEDDVPVTRYLYIEGFNYYAPILTVNVGDTVVWENNDNTKHTVTSDTGTELDSPLLARRATYSHTFTTAGEYSYHCTPHPSMKGKIIVR